MVIYIFISLQPTMISLILLMYCSVTVGMIHILFKTLKYFRFSMKNVQNWKTNHHMDDSTKQKNVILNPFLHKVPFCHLCSRQLMTISWKEAINLFFSQFSRNQSSYFDQLSPWMTNIVIRILLPIMNMSDRDVDRFYNKE